MNGNQPIEQIETQLIKQKGTEMKIIKHGPKPKSSYVVTAKSTRARDPVARMPHGKHDVRTGKISGTHLPPVPGGKKSNDD